MMRSLRRALSASSSADSEVRVHALAQVRPDQVTPGRSRCSGPNGRVLVPRQGHRRDRLGAAGKQGGVVELELTTSSSRIRSRSMGDMVNRLYMLVRALVAVGLTRSVVGRISRSSPRILPGEIVSRVGACGGAGFPVAQVLPDQAAPGRSRWSAPPDERPGPAGRGLVAFGASLVSRRRSFPERRGPGRVALAAGGVIRVVGPEALPAGGKRRLSERAGCSRGSTRQAARSRRRPHPARR